MKTIASLAPLLTIAGLCLASRPTVAQQLPNCQPPNTGELLLLVVTRSQADETKVRSALPSQANIVICQYYQDTVARVSGFRDQEAATSWAEYMKETVRLQAVVVRSSQTAGQPSPYPTSGPTTSYPTTNPGVYNPQPLGSGFAVLVQYDNRPEVALQVRQFLNREIGLVSYGQRPYLLAVHTTDLGIADAALRSLSNQGYAATLVDSRQVVLLKPSLNFSVGGY
jgi:hypothetical protein